MMNVQNAAAPDETGRSPKSGKKNKNSGSDSAVAKASAKEGKDARESKAAKTAGDVGADFQRLAADVAALRAEIQGMRTATAPPFAPQAGSGKKGKASAGDTMTTLTNAAPPVSAEASVETTLAGQAASALAERHDSAVLYGWAFRASGDEQQSGGRAVFGLAPLLECASDDRAARVAYALSSIPKIALARLLLAHGALPAARLGEEAHLTTGSLYHHLREMTHAGVVVSAGRSRYILTPTGQQATLLLLALTADEAPNP